MSTNKSTPMSDVTMEDVRAAITDDNKDLEEVATQFMNKNYDRASFDITLSSVHVKWDNPNEPKGESFLSVQFRYTHEDEDHPDAPFMNRPGWATLHCRDTTGEWYRNEDLVLRPCDDLYAEIKGRYAPHEGSEKAVEESLGRFFAGP